MNGDAGPRGARKTEIERSDPLYPPKLAELPDAPSRLYVIGDPSVLSYPSISIVGARRSTPYGVAVAEMAAEVAAESGVVVVSGGAIGCDRAAGAAAMRCGGRHVVVLGSGADVAYPKSSESLIADAIETGGAVISIERWGSPPRRWAFPKRNRVIAALSDALVVTEAGMPSGTFGTAECAVMLGREVLAVPGSILSPNSRGSNWLISNGACCISDPEALEIAISRIYGVLRLQSDGTRGSAGPRVDGVRAEALRILIASPCYPESLAATLSLEELACLRLLSEMEMDGLIERQIDGRYSASTTVLHASSGLGQNGRS